MPIVDALQTSKALPSSQDLPLPRPVGNYRVEVLQVTVNPSAPEQIEGTLQLGKMQLGGVATNIFQKHGNLVHSKPLRLELVRRLCAAGYSLKEAQTVIKQIESLTSIAEGADIQIGTGHGKSHPNFISRAIRRWTSDIDPKEIQPRKELTEHGVGRLYESGELLIEAIRANEGLRTWFGTSSKVEKLIAEGTISKVEKEQLRRQLESTPFPAVHELQEYFPTYIRQLIANWVTQGITPDNVADFFQATTDYTPQQKLLALLAAGNRILRDQPHWAESYTYTTLDATYQTIRARNQKWSVPIAALERSNTVGDWAPSIAKEVKILGESGLLHPEVLTAAATFIVDGPEFERQNAEKLLAMLAAYSPQTHLFVPLPSITPAPTEPALPPFQFRPVQNSTHGRFWPGRGPDEGDALHRSRHGGTRFPGNKF